MRCGLAALSAALLLTGTAWAQGVGGGADKETLSQKMHKEALAGGGFVKEDFVTDLGDGLKEAFGEKKGSKFAGNLGEKKLDDKELTDLLNGDLTKTETEDLFGCTRDETERVDEAVDKAVDKKNRKMFFGIVIIILVVDMDVDPSSEFCQQVAGSRDEVSPENFEKLLKGNVSKDLIKECFKFTDKKDVGFMQDALNQTRSSPFANHPFAKSMGMGDPAKFDPSKMPALEEGMPGFGAEGAPDMPPCPFMSANMGDFFECCKPPEEEESGCGCEAK
ncbi:MAG: hypothetical protein ACT4PV_12515 [Planctomycetaceae bacterium]